MRRLVWLFVVAGCNPLLGLAPTELLPDAPPSDEDVDGVLDATDNCIGVANANQSDEDDDGIGDLCDNCPLVANTPQEHIGDADAIGDDCDPHPTVDGDCLVLFDTFVDSAALLDHWSVLGTTPVLAATEGAVTITPDLSMFNPSALVARDDQGVPLTGTFDVQLSASMGVATPGALRAVSNASDGRTGWGCGIIASTPLYGYASCIGNGGLYAGLFLSSEPAGTNALFRLVSPGTQSPNVACRVGYGVAVGYGLAVPTVDTTPIGGSPGFELWGTPAEVRAIAIYRFAPGETCPAPITR